MIEGIDVEQLQSFFIILAQEINTPPLMKILKYLVFLILLIIIGGAIYFGTKDGSYVVQETITIPSPAEVVFDKVNDYKSWESWITWKQENPNMIFNYAEKTSGEGASFSWEGKNSGSITTTKLIPNKEILQDVVFDSPTGKSEAAMSWNFESEGDSTTVRWETRGEHSLMDKVYYAINDSGFTEKIQKLNEESLKNISQEVVADMKKYSINVDGVTQFGGGYYMYTTSVAKQQEVDGKATSMMKLVQGFVSDNNLNISGDPFILYNETDTINNTVIFSTGLPVKERVITPEGSPVVCGFMDSVSAVKVSLKGNYSHLAEALLKGMKFIEKNSHQVDSGRKIFEVYIIDSNEEPNPAKWLTEVYIPIVTSDGLTETGL